MKLHVMLLAAVLSCGFSAQALAGPMVVSCGPGQHAIVHDDYVRGEVVTRVECAGGRTYASGYRAPYGARYYREHRHRSWGQRALVIGGSAATGAGIGGIVHGKQGALIGAAVGGGVASLVEGARRR